MTAVVVIASNMYDDSTFTTNVQEQQSACSFEADFVYCLLYDVESLPINTLLTRYDFVESEFLLLTLFTVKYFQNATWYIGIYWQS